MKRTVAGLLVVSAAALAALSGCSGGSSQGPAADGRTTPPTVTLVPNGPAGLFTDPTTKASARVTLLSQPGLAPDRDGPYGSLYSRQVVLRLKVVGVTGTLDPDEVDAAHVEADGGRVFPFSGFRSGDCEPLVDVDLTAGQSAVEHLCFDVPATSGRLVFSNEDQAPAGFSVAIPQATRQGHAPRRRHPGAS